MAGSECRANAQRYNEKRMLRSAWRGGIRQQTQGSLLKFRIRTSENIRTIRNQSPWTRKALVNSGENQGCEFGNWEENFLGGGSR
jgi:hypothetical protein